MVLPSALPASHWLLAVAIFFSTFAYEDGATVLAATLSATGVLDLRLAYLSTFLGIWIGDIGLYLLGSTLGRRTTRSSLFQRFVSAESIAKAETWFMHRGAVAVIASRFVPGSRLPTYVAAGTLRHPFRNFAALTAVLSSVWVALIFAALHLLPAGKSPLKSPLFWVVAAVLLFAPWLLRKRLEAFTDDVRRAWAKYRRWEFWPMWLFYPPVALMCAWLGLKYRGLALPTIANPVFRNGGIIGESKIEVLRELMRAAPEYTADAYLVPAAEDVDLVDRSHMLADILQQREFSYPFVLKPDVAQRGDGFKLVRSSDEAAAYLSLVTSDVLVQRYAAGKKEIGVFYYRYPGQERGEIFAVTEKEFPAVVGDGVRTFDELLQGDARASLIAETYLARFPRLRGKVVAAGEKIKLVEAGNHCQGCIFHDGAHLMTEGLRRRIDQISRAIPGFYIGRYDLRYDDDAALARGEGFLLIELNGASSEATSIYDARNSLLSAYGTLYRQWELVYAIGAANRKAGAKAMSAFAVFKDWLAYRRTAVEYPAAD